MICRTIIGGTFLMMLVLPAAGTAQTHSYDPVLDPTIVPAETGSGDRRFELPVISRVNESHAPIKAGRARFHKEQFLILSTAVYGAAFADMHQTVKYRKYDWWYESDPLARPFVHLPSPAYYAAGFALATGVNWISWKMGRSKRWHRLAPIPQLLAIVGNTYGYKVSHFSSTN